MLTIHLCVATILQTSSLTRPFWSFSVVVESLWSRSRWRKLILHPKCFSRLIHFSDGKLQVDCWRFLLFFLFWLQERKFPDLNFLFHLRFEIPWRSFRCRSRDENICSFDVRKEIKCRRFSFFFLSSVLTRRLRGSLYCFSKCFLSPGVHRLDSSWWGSQLPCWSFRCPFTLFFLWRPSACSSLFRFPS